MNDSEHGANFFLTLLLVLVVMTLRWKPHTRVAYVERRHTGLTSALRCRGPSHETLTIFLLRWDLDLLYRGDMEGLSNLPRVIEMGILTGIKSSPLFLLHQHFSLKVNFWCSLLSGSQLQNISHHDSTTHTKIFSHYGPWGDLQEVLIDVKSKLWISLQTAYFQLMDFYVTHERAFLVSGIVNIMLSILNCSF